MVKWFKSPTSVDVYHLTVEGKIRETTFEFHGLGKARAFARGICRDGGVLVRTGEVEHLIPLHRILHIRISKARD